MIPGYIIFLIFFVVLYAFTNENRQFGTTASALREIWSGGCRLACCPSECSGLSGLGAAAGPAAGPSQDCSCQFCPCPLIDSVIRSCGPATSAYSTTVDTIAEFYYSVLKMLAELFVLVHSVLEGGVSHQRPAQLLSLNALDSDENFSFEGPPPPSMLPEDSNKGKTIDKIKQKLSTLDKQDLNLNKLGPEKSKSVTSIKSLKESVGGVIKQVIKDVKLNKKKSAEFQAHTSKDTSEDVLPSASTSSGHCPRCVEKGKICIGSCPKSNVRRDK